MAGFQRREMPKNKIEIDDDDLDIDIDTDIEDDEIEDSPITKNKPKSPPNSGNGSKKGQKKIVRQVEKKDDNVSKYVIAGVVGVLIIATVVFFSIKSSQKKALEEQALLEQLESQKQVLPEEKVKAGVPNLNGAGAEQNDERLYDPSLITKDLNGEVVDTNYNVVSNEEIIDFITYTKYRAPMGDGVEFYWLEAEYKGQSYKVQVPYSVYSKLDREGITVVDIELLTLEGGSKMVTYMRVRKDAKALLDKNR